VPGYPTRFRVFRLVEKMPPMRSASSALKLSKMRARRSSTSRLLLVSASTREARVTSPFASISPTVLPRIALDQVLHGRVQMVLQGEGDDDVFPGLPQTVAERLQAAVLTREPAPNPESIDPQYVPTDGFIGDLRRYNRNSLISSPIPSIATVTVFTGSFITPTPTEVPTAMRSPGSRVMSWEILLTSSCALKIMSAIG